MELSPLIKQDSIDLNAYTDVALEQLRMLGDGKLIALSPVFSATATFYNKELFDRFGVAYPTNNMSWQSMMELAKHFARSEGGKPYYGIVTSQLPFGLVQRYINGTGAAYLSEDRKKALYNSDSYRLAMEAAIEAYRTGAFYLPPEKQTDNKFISGEAAIALFSPSLIDGMKQASAKGQPTVKWDIVTEPVDPKKPNISSFGANIQEAFAISAESSHKSEAWSVIKAIMSKEMADELAKTKSSVLSTRKDSVLTIDGRRMDAFYAHKPDSRQSGGETWPVQLAQQVSVISSEEITNMIYDRKSVADGISALQSRTQQAIDEEFAAKK
ncbi:MAG: ABC-type sugar transport system, periplasmic component [Paenibacillus sp.]|nr:ABC-type sugar transport system, periplasmic component [Paenibacillus sp.]